MGNVKFSYLYRDGSNYKNWGEIVFANPEELSVNVILKALEKAFDSNFFIAHQVRIPEIFDFPDHELTPDDHCYHEFDKVEITNEGPNDADTRSINQFLSEVIQAANIGWRAFQRGNSSFERWNVRS